VYLEDVTVFSRNVDAHIRHLRDVLLLLKKAGVSLKPSKCHQFQQEVEYLGHVVRSGQLLANQKNIKTLAQALPPRSQPELKSFLGMCNVYWRFIKDYAHIAKPMTKLTRERLPHVLPPLDARTRSERTSSAVLPFCIFWLIFGDFEATPTRRVSPRSRPKGHVASQTGALKKHAAIQLRSRIAHLSACHNYWLI